MRSPGEAIDRPNAAIELAPSLGDVRPDRKALQRAPQTPMRASASGAPSRDQVIWQFGI